AADSDVEVMHKILKEQPDPVESLNPQVPGELRRVIRRTLAKSADQRFQSMKDLAIELRELFETWDSLSPSHTSAGSAPSAAPAVGPAGRGLRAAVAVAALLGFGGLGYGLATFLVRGRPASPAPAGGNDLRFSVLMSLQDLNVGELGGTVLSADGRYLAYVTKRDRTSSLKVRQVRTGSDVTIAPGTRNP